MRGGCAHRARPCPNRAPGTGGGTVPTRPTPPFRGVGMGHGYPGRQNRVWGVPEMEAMGRGGVEGTREHSGGDR